MNAGQEVIYKGEAWVSRGSAAPGVVTIQREDNPRAWRVVSVADVAVQEVAR